MGEIQEELKAIRSLVEESKTKKKKPKQFKFPMSAKVNHIKAKNNFITVLKINENLTWNFKRVQISDQTFIEEGIPRLAAAGYVMYYKKNPCVILPSWSVEPFNPRTNYSQSLTNGSNTKGYSLLMARMKSETINPKKQMGSMVKWVIGLILAAIIGYALMTGGG